MVSDLRGVVDVEVLLLQDVLQLVNALQGVVHVSRKVTVEEANHVAVEGEADRHSAFVALHKDTEFQACIKRFYCVWLLLSSLLQKTQ